MWKKRRGHFNTVGRMFIAHARDSERYHLRMLLAHVPGAESYEHLRTVNGVVCPTNKEACIQVEPLTAWCCPDHVDVATTWC